jgi:uncharacterized repeat protein (TIGR01451 family)
MRRIAPTLSLVAFALGVMNGCAATRPPGALNTTADRDPSRTLVADPLVQAPRMMPLAFQPQPQPQPQTSVAQVAHFEDAGCTVDQGLPGDCQACNPAGQGVCQGQGFCRGCQSCVVQPHGYAPYPAGYFNPYLIDPNEFICDGGDNAPSARARVGDQIIGVELEDTVVRYTTDAGDVHVQPSNKVCLYAPRFAAVRKVTGAESGELAVGAIGVAQPEGPSRAELVQPGLAITGRNELGRGSAVRGPDAMRERNRGVPVERVLQIEVAEDVLTVLQNLAFINRGILRDSEKPWLSNAAQSAVTWSVDEQAAVTVNDVAAVTLTRDLSAEELVVYDFPDAGRLRLCKLADKSDALPGEIVTFILRVDNVGDSAVRNIVITDSLVTRLEYVADSEKASVESEFTTEENEGQSLRLTWKLAKELKVGEGATIEFKCKVR